MTDAVELVNGFHGHLRDKTKLTPGYVVDLRKAAWEVFVNDRDSSSVADVGGMLDHMKDFVDAGTKLLLRVITNQIRTLHRM